MNRCHEHAQILLEKARGDVAVLARLLPDPQVPDWAVGFHAQQAVEKAMKAVLQFNDLDFPYNHDLEALVRLLRGASLPLPPDAADLPKLTPFAATLRYDRRLPIAHAGPLERGWALTVVRRTIDWAESALGGGEGP